MFAASPYFTEIIGFNSELVTSNYLVEWDGGAYFQESPVTEDAYRSGGYSLFNLNLPAEGSETTSYLRISQPVVYLPVDGYDIYFISVVRGMTRLYPEYQHEFSFYPSTAKLFTVNDTHNGTNALNVSDILHTDARYADRNCVFMGFSAIWKLSPTDNNSVSYIEYSASGSKTIHRNTVFNNYIVYVPVGSDTDQSVEAIVSAIENQTQLIMDSMQQQTDDLMGVPDEQVQAAEKFVNDSNAQLQEALSPLMAAEQLSGSLVNAFRSKEKYQVYFPGVVGPFMPDGSTVTIIQPQTVDMSFMDRFSIITDAIGVVMLGLCGWKTLDFLYNTLMKILGKEGDES